MKRVLFLAVLAMLVITSYGQSLQETYNAATYQGYDSTTFILGTSKGIQMTYVDFTTFNADDAVIRIGATGNDMLGTGNLSWTVNGTSVDSVVMSKTVYLQTLRFKSGSRSHTHRIYFWCSESFPTNFITFTVKWNSVTTGKLEIYY